MIDLIERSAVGEVRARSTGHWGANPRQTDAEKPLTLPVAPLGVWFPTMAGQQVYVWCLLWRGSLLEFACRCFDPEQLAVDFMPAFLINTICLISNDSQKTSHSLEKPAVRSGYCVSLSHFSIIFKDRQFDFPRRVLVSRSTDFSALACFNAVHLKALLFLLLNVWNARLRSLW